MNDHDASKCMCPWCVDQRALVYRHDEVAAHLHEWPDAPDDN